MTFAKMSFNAEAQGRRGRKARCRLCLDRRTTTAAQVRHTLQLRDDVMPTPPGNNCETDYHSLMDIFREGWAMKRFVNREADWNSLNATWRHGPRWAEQVIDLPQPSSAPFLAKRSSVLPSPWQLLALHR